MTIINIPDSVIDSIEKTVFVDTKITPTQIVRVGLLYLKQSNLSRDNLFSLIGQSATDTLLIDSLEKKK